MAAGSHIIRIDRSKPLRDEPQTGHNRWHPNIPPALRVDPGDTVALERGCLRWGHYVRHDGHRSPSSRSERRPSADRSSVYQWRGTG